MSDIYRCPGCGRTEGMTDNEPCSVECAILDKNEILEAWQGSGPPHGNDVEARMQAAGLRIKPLAWHNFGAYSHWAESVSGTYSVEARNGLWRVELRVGGLVHFIGETDTTTEEDFSAAQAAAEADHRARILAMLEVAGDHEKGGAT